MGDPQTSGGVLVVVDPGQAAEFRKMATQAGVEAVEIGTLIPQGEKGIVVKD